MLFNSYEFIFFFLPLTLAGFFVLGGRAGKPAAISFLVFASLFFYGWWNPRYLILILASMLFNYAVGLALAKAGAGRKGRILLTLGVSANLGLLAYFKYRNFFVENLNQLMDSSVSLVPIVLPLAISFFTFQQIAYLVDARRGEAREYRFMHYCLFVTFFPQLIAGPIVHHKEMLPQFANSAAFRFSRTHLAIGLTIFAIGLFKKAVLADGIAVYASPIFADAANGENLDFFTAWGGALAYTFQLYFDFSGYSDMAIGAARMFGIRLPVNFNSPYKSVNIIEFWRRWHMTLSRFLKDYLYIPLGGGRGGKVRRYTNLIVTMLLGGLWHGAGWTFVVWGLLHGIYLMINHAWRAVVGESKKRVAVIAAQAVTFVAVVVGWVFFRAADFDSAMLMIKGMAGFNGINIPAAIGWSIGPLKGWLETIGIEFTRGGGGVFVANYVWIITLGIISFLLPNTQTLLRKYRSILNPPQVGGWSWRMSPAWGIAAGATAALGILALPQVSEFLYFQF